ncbi:hypothetical protein SAMN05443574_104294 [Haloarcula vallismortis]|uniref:DUF7973 domain-containing protein n=2 Tax=Haloarcula vallismortis TaxID=28442 RepID=A0A1H2UM77_HALVA|nr:hypothetical protein [Haloarcula vallismortis]SDW57263.1 hypothetical protein SAMN05443574_104294 [Haloarcula vallismortis]
MIETLPLQIPVFGMGVPDLLLLIIAAFAGGAFGAAVGALPAFCFTGFMVIAGQAVAILRGSIVGQLGELGADGLATGVTGAIAFGPVFGPHISFAGGAAAAAYAAKSDGMYEPDDGDYHPAKDIAYALGTRPDILAVGGLFGIFGMVVRQVSGGLALPWDPIALGVVLSAAAHRVVFGYPLIGAGSRNILDMSPFENGEKRVATDGGSGEATTDGGVAESYRLAVEPWLPHQYRWANVAMIGLVAGLLGGWIALQTGSAFLGFGISAASLTFLNLGVEKIPVTHHMTLPASTAALAVFGGAPELGTMAAVVAILVAGVFGAYGALIGEVVQRVFYAHSDTHFDPPAAAIVVATLTVFILAVVGVFGGTSWVPALGMV